MRKESASLNPKAQTTDPKTLVMTPNPLTLFNPIQTLTLRDSNSPSPQVLSRPELAHSLQLATALRQVLLQVYERAAKEYEGSDQKAPHVGVEV